MEFLTNYGLFLLEIVTLVVAILILFAGIIAIAGKGKTKQDGKIKIEKINDLYQEMKETIRKKILNKSELKKINKEEKAKIKAEKKSKEKAPARRIFLLDFEGDIRASDVQHLREEITAILTVANPEYDEVVVRLESPGGMVHGYGLAASQLQRIREHDIPLTVCVDKVAASGGYMMAAVANKILSAPFAIIGSIGVVAQLPNLHRFLKNKDIDVELLTAGEYKRTLTVFGENTKKGRQKLQEDLEDTHRLFKEFIKANRNNIDIDQIATGEHWFGTMALDFNLVDELMTSDDYLLKSSDAKDIYKVSYKTKRSFSEKVLHKVEVTFVRFLNRFC